MNEPKIHHYVPQGYLRFFAKREQRDSQEKYWLLAYDKKICKSYPINVSKAAAEKDYNRLELSEHIQLPPENDPLYYEKKYIDLIEGKLPGIIKNLTAACTLSTKGAKILTPAVKDDLADLITVQVLRTPDVRTRLGKIGEKSYHKILTAAKLLAAEIPDETRRSEQLRKLNELLYTDEFIKSEHLFCTTDADRLSRIKKALIDDHVWVIYQNMTEQPYITSDIPVVLSDMSDGSVGFGTNGIAQPTTIITMPLTPKYLIAVYHEKSLVGRYAGRDGECIPLDHSEKAFIKHVNRLQFKNCWRQVYTHPAAKFQDFQL